MNSKAGYRILIVDDEPEYQKVVSLILDGAGYHTDACSNGREAIEFVLLRLDLKRGGHHQLRRYGLFCKLN